MWVHVLLRCVIRRIWKFNGNYSKLQTYGKWKRTESEKLDSTALKLSVNNKDYGLASSTFIYVENKTIYMIFDASVIELLVSIASGDYIIRETNNDNPDFVTAQHLASEYKLS